MIGSGERRSSLMESVEAIVQSPHGPGDAGRSSRPAVSADVCEDTLSTHARIHDHRRPEGRNGRAASFSFPASRDRHVVAQGGSPLRRTGVLGDWTPERIDERYRPFFEHCAGARVRGESTPIYLFFPEIARELKRYNPELKLIVLLRDPSSERFRTTTWRRTGTRSTAPCGWPC